MRAFRSPSAQRLVPPSKTSIHRILSELDPDALDAAMRRFTAARRAPGGTLALDGKSRPLNRPGGSDAERLLRELGVAGRTATLDALHCCPKTARLIVDGGGDYVMPVKGNHAALLDDIRILGFDDAPSRSTLDKAHGRLEQRTCAVVPLDAFDDDVAPLPGRRQAFRVVRLIRFRTEPSRPPGLRSTPPPKLQRNHPRTRSPPATPPLGLGVRNRHQQTRPAEQRPSRDYGIALPWTVRSVA